MFTLFVISEVDHVWTVHRHGKEISSIAAGLPSEKEAMDVALPLAESDKPSRVVKIDKRGNQSLVATFAENE